MRKVLTELIVNYNLIVFIGHGVALSSNPKEREDVDESQFVVAANGSTIQSDMLLLRGSSGLVHEGNQDDVLLAARLAPRFAERGMAPCFGRLGQPCQDGWAR